jgi:hypothetical protein
MKIVLVKHTDDGKEFAFYVPDELVPFVRKGQGVLCNTRHGISFGTTTTGVFCGSGARDVAIAHGAYFPMQPIVAFEHVELANADTIRKAVTREIMQKIAAAYGESAC